MTSPRTSARNPKVATSSVADAGSLIAVPRLLIRASAGTGKTFQLSSRYIALLRHSLPERILASTFTRKAAGEILERILLRLARASTSPASLKELGESIGGTPLSRAECLQMLTQLTRQLHRVRISTLDAFFAQLAGIHALELGLPSGWRMLDPIEVSEIRDEALEQMLRSGDQQALVQLMHLLDKGDSSRSISGLMRQTVEDMYHVFVDSPAAAWDRFPDYQFLSEDVRENLLAQMEQIALSQKRLLTARTNDAGAYREERWEDFLQKGLLPKIRSGERTYFRIAIPDDLCEFYLQLSEHCLAVTATAWKQQTRAAWKLLADYHLIFEHLKHAAGGLEFQDVTRRLAENPESSNRRNIAFRMDGTIEHLLLDEFQDTSRPQWEVIRTFAEEACRLPQRSFFCVGDTKQAIYGWRGGEAAIFDAIEQQLPDLKAEPLNLSYRSSPVVIEAVNQAMSALHQHDNLEESSDLLADWCRKFPRHETTRKQLSGYVCLRTGPEAPESEEGSPSRREQKEYFWKSAAEYIASLVHQSPQRTIGVLTRTNATVGRLIFELSRLGIEASEEGGNPLTDSAAVQLVLSLMHLADHPGDSIAAFHVSQSPLAKVLEFPNHTERDAVTKLSLELRQRLIRSGYGGVIHDLAIRLAPVCDRREHRRLMQLAGLADRFDSLFSTLRASEFTHYARSQRCEEPTNSNVRVMNVHQSKGLEFDIVVLPELDSPLIRPSRYVTRTGAAGKQPDLVALSRNESCFTSLGGDLLEARKQTRDRVLQESLCLLYVALTRAARSLHLLIPPKVSAKHPKSFAGLLRAALAPNAPLEPNQILWEIGDPDWDKSVTTSSSSKKSEPAGRVVATSNSELRFAPDRKRRHRTWTTPSEQKQQKTTVFSARAAIQTFSAAQRGSLFHSWLQLMPWGNASPTAAARQQAVAQLGLSGIDLAEQWRQFQACLKSDAVQQLLCENEARTRAELALPPGLSKSNLTVQTRTELPFVQETGTGEIMNGTIDRVVLFLHEGTPFAAEVIDYKTDQVKTPDDVTRLTEFYRGQLLAYRDAVAAMFSLKPQQISLSLAFLGSGEVVSL